MNKNKIFYTAFIVLYALIFLISILFLLIGIKGVTPWVLCIFSILMIFYNIKQRNNSKLSQKEDVCSKPIVGDISPAKKVSVLTAPKEISDKATTEKAPISETKTLIQKDYESIKTYIAGLEHTPGKSNLKKLISHEKEYLDKEELWEGFTNKEIEDGDYEVYELSNFLGYDNLKFIPEPKNPYDPNAIKIVHDDFGQLGYVPAKHINNIRTFIKKNPDYKLSWELKGGKKKIYDDKEDKIITITTPYYINIEISNQ